MEDLFSSFFNFTAWLPPPSEEDNTNVMLEIFKRTNWKQPWLIAIILFHIACFLSSICLRKSLRYQCISMVVLTLLALASELINEYASIHWEKFADDAYFDSAGLFITFVFNMPLLFNIFVTVLLAISNAAEDLVKLKRLELAQKMKKTK